MTLSPRQKTTAILLLFYWPTIFILAHIQIPDVVRQADVSDKSLHFLTYWILAFLLWSTFNNKKVHWHKAKAWGILLLIVGYGVIDERLQGYIAGRSPDLLDFSSDVIGAVVSLIVLTFLTFWPALLVIIGVTIFILTNITRVDLSNLLPITNKMSHLFAYAFFTALWIGYLHLRENTEQSRNHKTTNSALSKDSSIRKLNLKSLILMLTLPASLLLGTKLASLALGRDFTGSEMLISAMGIVAVLAIAIAGMFIQKIRNA